MARILWLPGVLKAAGVRYVEEPGWRTRGRDDFDPRGLIAHATAAPLTQTNNQALSVIINGRVGLPGPIGQVMIERGTGIWRIVASGAGNHAMTGWGGPLAGLGNRTLIGIECHHNNNRPGEPPEPWTPVVYDSYARGVAAICAHMKWNTTRVALHREHQPGSKSDTTFDAGRFRARVAAYVIGEAGLSEASNAAIEAWRLGLERDWLGRPVEPVKWRVRDEQWQAAVMARLSAFEKTLTAIVQALGSGTTDAAAIITKMEQLAEAEMTRDATVLAEVRREREVL